MANFIRVPGVNPPSSRPRVDLADGILPDAGALYLVDAAHPAGGLGAGVPVNGATVPNLVGSSAADLIQSTDIDATVQIISADVKMERTPRGGFHVVPSNTVTGTRFAMVRLNGTAFDTYIKSNWEHDYYLSLWVKTTRAPVGTGTPPFLAAIAENSAGYLADIYYNTSAYTSYPTTSGDHSESFIGRSADQSLGVGSPRRLSLGVSSYMRNTGTAPNAYIPAAPSGASTVKFQAFGVGKYGSYAAVDNSFTDPGAVVFYRSYLEDLTVSGRTYAQVEAIDQALYTQDVLTEGGRYYGDTYTDPATLA